MIKNFGPYTLVERGLIYKLKQLIFTYKLRDSYSIIDTPQLLVVGTTHDSSTRILCPLKVMRQTPCDPMQNVTFVVDMDKHEVFDYTIYIYNFENIERLHSVKTVFSTAKDVPVGDSAIVQDDTCDIEKFIFLNSSPAHNEEDVSISINPLLTFNHEVDSNTLSAIELWEYYSGINLFVSSAITLNANGINSLGMSGSSAITVAISKYRTLNVLSAVSSDASLILNGLIASSAITLQSNLYRELGVYNPAVLLASVIPFELRILSPVTMDSVHFETVDIGLNGSSAITLNTNIVSRMLLSGASAITLNSTSFESIKLTMSGASAVTLDGSTFENSNITMTIASPITIDVSNIVSMKLRGSSAITITEYLDISD